MPRYTFKNKETSEIEVHYVSISDYDNFKESNSHLERYIEPGESTPMGDPVRLGIRTVDNGFREVLSKIHSNNYKSNLANKLSRKWWWLKRDINN